MTRKQRLHATLARQAVDCPAVNFYELNGLDENPNDTNPYNIYNHPSWLPLIELTRDFTDRIVMRGLPVRYACDPLAELTHTETFTAPDGTHNVITEIRAGNRTLRQHTKRERDINTVWVTEHLLKDEQDLAAWITLPPREGAFHVDTNGVLSAEETLGDSGIVMLDVSSALCTVASLFSMEDFTVIAMTEPALFEAAIEKVHVSRLRDVEAASRELPGRLWRIHGPEYAAPPYLPPQLYKEYVAKYDRQLVAAIQAHGGYARLHQHGMLRDTLDMIVDMGVDAIDPIEPPPQGDVTLKYVRERYGDELILFGNLEASDIETLPPAQFERNILTALEEGGKNFVLMPSACPYGRVLSERALENYRLMVKIVKFL
ncbi:MAG: hypothetical protein FWE06_02595 [Oscillospiraceae bacterium]|nr:hypothetical protein [Oscillospiraceae bacterium]